MSNQTVSLKLVGPATYSNPSVFNRPLKRGEVAKEVPLDVAEELMQLGHGDPDTRDFRPYFEQEVERVVTRRGRRGLTLPVAEQEEAAAAADEDGTAKKATTARRTSQRASTAKPATADTPEE